jgi:thiopurine S-methyltransferase
MEHEFWLKRWKTQDIGFHQPQFDPALDKFWSRLAVPAGARVFVPLCGKSLDMQWLAERGHAVVGAELSEQAVDEFFAERDLVPNVRREGGFTVKSSGPYDSWVGDFFALPPSAVAGVAGIYDRAALVALPADMQRRYADKLKALLPTAPILLITIDYDQREMDGPPFATSPKMIDALFLDRYERVDLVSKDVLAGHPRFQQRGLTALTGAVFLLRPR